MRFSWAVDGLGGFVICHAATSELYKFPYGICSPINGATKWELIGILEDQQK
jgi:hypothetical protein